MAEEGSRSAEESTPGLPGIFTSVLTPGALCFALVTIARNNEWVWTHPYLKPRQAGANDLLPRLHAALNAVVCLNNFGCRI